MYLDAAKKQEIFEIVNPISLHPMNKSAQSETISSRISDWTLLFIGWREIGFTISFNVSWAAFAIMFEDMLKDATVKEIEDYF